ncbi:MAG: addiction module protein [Methylovulum miyakonense]|uniref:addiction module protein n=1 Tax=Methylovulum miyakonense TaxID=645578 RepID=UPI003BB7D02C
MSALLIEIEQQASLLPPDDRAKLAEFLLESLQEQINTGIEQDWEREITRRVSAFEAGEIATIPAQTVFDEAKRLVS